MSTRVDQQQIDECFDLYLKYNGTNFVAIQREMREQGWEKFNSQRIRKKINGEYVGWEIEFGWKAALEVKIRNRGKESLTTAESLLFKAETILELLFEKVKTVKDLDRDTVYQIDKFIGRVESILARLDKARDNYGNFVYFFKQLMAASTKISPSLAKEICDAEDALIDWAEREFTTKDETIDDA